MNISSNMTIATNPKLLDANTVIRQTGAGTTDATQKKADGSAANSANTPKEEPAQVLRGPAVKDDLKLEAMGPALDADVLEAKLKNVKATLEGVTAAVKAGGLERLGVTAGAKVAGSELSALAGKATAADHLGALIGGPEMTGGKQGQYSNSGDDLVQSGMATAGGQAVYQAAAAGMRGLVTTSAGGVATVGEVVAGGGAGAAAGYLLAAFAGGAAIGYGIHKGVEAATGQTIGDWLYDWTHPGEDDPAPEPQSTGTTGTPIRDSDTSSGPPVITQGVLDGLAARKGAKGEPTADDAGTSSGGAVDPQKVDGGLGQVATYTADGAAAHVAVTGRDIKDIAARLTANVTTIR